VSFLSFFQTSMNTTACWLPYSCLLTACTSADRPIEENHIVSVVWNTQRETNLLLSHLFCHNCLYAITNVYYWLMKLSSVTHFNLRQNSPMGTKKRKHCNLLHHGSQSVLRGPWPAPSGSANTCIFL